MSAKPATFKQDREFLKSYGLTPASKPDFFLRNDSLLAIYMLLSAGVYGLYWMYRNWDAVRLASSKTVTPLVNAILFPLYLWPLLKIIIVLAKAQGYKPRIPFSGGQLTLLAILPVGTMLVWRPYPHNPWMLLGYVIAGAYSALALLLAQQAILSNAKRRGANPYNKATWVETIFLLLVIGSHWPYS